MPGKAYGVNRDYQVLCRDVLVHRKPTLRPWSGDGVDVPFDLPDTQWTLDVALRDDDTGLVVAECRRTVASSKQEDIAAFAYKVELLRKALQVPVAASFFTKSGHQIGAVKVGQFSGIDIIVLDDGAQPPGFNMTFLRYDPERERKAKDNVMHVTSGSFSLTGSDVGLIYTKRDGTNESR